MDREFDVVVSREEETGRWGRLNISARQKCKKGHKESFEQSTHEGKSGGAECSGKGVSHRGWCVCKKKVDPWREEIRSEEMSMEIIPRGIQG